MEISRKEKRLIRHAKNLLTKGRSLNAQTRFKHHSLLHIAATNNYLELADFLLNNRANVNCRSKQGNTPLLKAVKHGHLKMVALLLQYNANIKLANIHSQDALSRARHLELAEILLEELGEANDYPSYQRANESRPLDFCKMAAAGEVGMIALLLTQLNFPVDATADNVCTTAMAGSSIYCDTPLYEAVRFSISRDAAFQCAHLLIKHGANVNHIVRIHEWYDSSLDPDDSFFPPSYNKNYYETLLASVISYQTPGSLTFFKTTLNRVALLLLENGANPFLAGLGSRSAYAIATEEQRKIILTKTLHYCQNNLETDNAKHIIEMVNNNEPRNLFGKQSDSTTLDEQAFLNKMRPLIMNDNDSQFNMKSKQKTA